ncbi:hypothetical protein UFOVP1155_18 [uncultured Caudovirales phage]|uniref:DNA transfer protein n=1 Tax=uncultured Caudovirales phage TaxID=2100421 RepID=A0A6J5QY22_9CAUD|nr:hypothetical protein UFOVP1155_18 [uncultured Caudovirales phage]
MASFQQQQDAKAKGFQTAEAATLKAASAARSANTPAFQAALKEYNATGKASDPAFNTYFQSFNNYFKQGQAAPGNLTPSLMAGAEKQWGVDAQPSKWDQIAPTLMGLTAVAMGVGVANGFGGASSAGASGGLTLPGGALADTSGAVLAGGAGSGQGLGLATLGTALTPAQAAAASGQMSNYIASGGNSLANLSSGGNVTKLLPNGSYGIPAAASSAIDGTKIPTPTPTPMGNALTSLANPGAGALLSGASSLIGANIASQSAADARAYQEKAARESIAGMNAAQASGSNIQTNQLNLADAEQKKQFDAGNAMQKDQYGNSLASLTGHFNEGMAGLKTQFDAGKAYQTPWYEAGKNALTAQNDLMGLGANGSAGQLAALQSAPGYQFRKQLGQQGFDSGVASRGGMGSGKAATGAIEYNQNFASNEYGNRLAQLSGVSQQGQRAGTDIANQGNAFAQNQAQLGANVGRDISGLNTNYGNNFANRSTDYGNNFANQRINYGNNQANSLSTLAANNSNILTGLGNAQGASSIAQGNAQQSGWLGAGNALNSWMNPTPQNTGGTYKLVNGQYVPV